MSRLIGIIQIVLSLAMLCGLATSCAIPSPISTSGSTPAPPASEYPADISGHVIIAEKVIAKYDRNKPDTTELTPLEGQIFWIVDISVNNKAYENPVTASYKDWKIVAGDKVYDSQKPFMDIWPSTDMSVPVGDSGETIIRFPVPDTLEVSSAKLSYQGQEPYSYGNLSGGDKVAVYDWDLKKVVEETGETRDSGELYVVPDEQVMGNTTTKQLRTVARWSGTEDEAINFSIDKSPWVINGSYDVVSSLGHNFEYLIFTKDEYSAPDPLREMWGHELLMPTRFPSLTDPEHYLVKQSGKFVICVYASGVRWQLRVGVE